MFKYLFYEDMDEVSELRRTYIEELNRSIEVARTTENNDDQIDNSFITSSRIEDQAHKSLSEATELQTRGTETDEGISVRSNHSTTEESFSKSSVGQKAPGTKRKHLSDTICRIGSDSSSESTWSEPNIMADILKAGKNTIGNSDSMSSSDIEQEPHPASSVSSRRSSSSIDTPKEMRSLEECIRVMNVGEVKNLTDDEILQMIDTKNIRAFELEKVLEDHLRGVEVRRRLVLKQAELANTAIKAIPYRNYNYDKVLGQCAENVIGYMTLPLGVAGPLKINNKFYTIPMATTEGCLIASTNRGCSALRSCGVKTVVTEDKMTRAPAVRFESVMRAAEVKRWIEDLNNESVLKVIKFFIPKQSLTHFILLNTNNISINQFLLLFQKQFDSTSRFARLKNIFVRINSNILYIRFEAFTGDAMGMNMVSKATEFTLKYLKDEFPDMQILTLSSNMCTDKKPSALNWIKGRGKSVVAEAIIPRDIVERTLKTTAEALVDINIVKNKTGT